MLNQHAEFADSSGRNLVVEKTSSSSSSLSSSSSSSPLAPTTQTAQAATTVPAVKEAFELLEIATSSTSRFADVLQFAPSMALPRHKLLRGMRPVLELHGAMTILLYMLDRVNLVQVMEHHRELYYLQHLRAIQDFPQLAIHFIM
jgi:hypothetical protein